MLQVTYDPFEWKHPPAPNGAIKTKIFADKKGVDVVGAETLRGLEFLQRFEVIFHILLVLFNVLS